MPGIIQDLFGNELQSQTSPMIGWVEPEAAADVLSLDMYKFIIEIIRQEDSSRGNLFLKRFLDGPQNVWRQTTQSIFDLKKIWDISETPEHLLPYLKRFVGWTPDLDSITDNLDSLTLRRLIAASVPFWKKRGPEDAIVDILRLTTTARVRILNWFDLRMIIGETAWGEDHSGYDPWIISTSGDSEYNIRIVDNGTLDRALVRNLARLTRPVGETVVITYLGFMDLFETDDDTSQWTLEATPLGDATPTLAAVSSGVMTLSTGSQTEEAYANDEGSDDWSDYVVTFRIRGLNYRVEFYRTGNVDFYEVFVSGDGILYLNKRVGGAFVELAEFDLASILIEPHSDVFNAIRIEAIPESSSTRIKVYFEAVNVINTTDDSHTQGTIGFGHADGASDFAVLSEVEMFFNPCESDTISINS